MAKIGYTRKPDGQNRLPPSTLVPGRHDIAQRPPRPDSGRISNGSTRFWLLTPPSATRFQSHLPDDGRAVCTLFIFLRAKKIRQLKNDIIIGPPQHDTLKCFLDVDSFQGGSFNLSENICDLISFMFYCLNSPQGRRLIFCGCSGCSASTNAQLITISCFLDADSFTGFVKGPRRSFYNPTRFFARLVCKICISAAAILFPVQ